MAIGIIAARETHRAASDPGDARRPASPAGQANFRAAVIVLLSMTRVLLLGLLLLAVASGCNQWINGHLQRHENDPRAVPDIDPGFHPPW